MGLILLLELLFLNTLLHFGHTQDAVLTLEPNWSEVFVGESVTFVCDMREREDGDWYYIITRNDHEVSRDQHYKLRPLTKGHSGEYQCRGDPKFTGYRSKKSNKITITVSEKPRPILTVFPLWLSPGTSVSLSCKIEDPSAGWRFYWYKAVPKIQTGPTVKSYSYELLPGSSDGTKEDSYIIDGPTHTAGYMCRSGRGNPVYYTQDSQPKFVWSGDQHSLASIKVTPNRVQHFSLKSISLTCEGTSAEWRIRRAPDEDPKLACSNWQEMTGSTCNIDTLEHNAAYWCESELGQFSNAVNISVHTQNLILESPVHPVSEGESVTLGCKIRTGSFASSVSFYKNDKLIQADTSGQMTILAVSKLDEGFYKCKSTTESPQSWMAVTSSRTENSSFVVLLVVGLVSGILLLVFLLLLCYYLKSKDLCCHRSSHSQRTKQGANMDENFNSNKSEGSGHSRPQHGDAPVYESVKDPGEAENGGPAEEFNHTTDSSIQLKNLVNKDEYLMYAQITLQNKRKDRNKKGLSTDAEHTEMIYSEVKPGSAVGP
ncbi:hypothetical protein LDENG_00196860 [Lucifuga dentata]|nr:hypothetical protein LDENG_00196860 [Lucifuga dentata]